jgi:membrane-associated phospholipid phosphatase
MVTSPEQRPDRFLPYLTITCCAVALLLTFIRLIELDAPLTRFVRSLNEFHIEYLHSPWLRTLSDSGNELGRGESLLLVHAVLLAAGYVFQRASLKRAGWETLIAHLLAGGINTVLKHLVGRGRPKFMHGDHSEFFPFGGAGWDSFPSGHSMATFAVAAVLAVRFPKIRWLVIFWALAVSVSRLFRASHFLTDIVAGAVLGVVIGTVVAHPWKDRRSSFTSALMTVTPPVAGLLAVMTTVGQHPSEGRMGSILSQGGLLVCLAGMTVYLVLRIRPALLPASFMQMGAVALMGLGIAMCSESLWVATVILLVCLAYWLNMDFRVQASEAGSHRAWPYEAAFGLAILLTLLTMIELRGALAIG